jgi:hypothetical protein
MSAATKIPAAVLVNEAEVRDNLHLSVERIIETTRPRRYALPLAVSGDALARARRNVRLESA